MEPGKYTASIELARGSQQITLLLRDRGKGIPLPTLQALRHGLLTQGVGFAAMQERLREVGGHLQVDSNSEGTCLRAVIPLKNETP